MPRTPPAQVRALLLDFDGLICDTERAGHRAWCEAYVEHGLTFPDALWRSMMGRPDGELRAAAHLARQVPGVDEAAVVAWRRRRKARLCEAEPLRPGVRELLDAAARHGVPAAVVSSSPRGRVAPHLERLGVLDRFALLVTGDLTERPKPHPDLYQRALGRLGRTPGQAVAFEDSPVGVSAARAAGVYCVAVPSSVGTPDELVDADLVLPSLADFALVTVEGRVA